MPTLAVLMADAVRNPDILPTDVQSLGRMKGDILFIIPLNKNLTRREGVGSCRWSEMIVLNRTSTNMLFASIFVKVQETLTSVI